MITVSAANGFLCVVKPTMFPDGTSQIWKLPDEMLRIAELKVTWNFESEREVIDILSLCKLIPRVARVHLHIPFLPYGRQDKMVSNSTTFNLRVLGDMLNTANLDKVTSVDCHNPEATEQCINKFVNLSAEPIHRSLLSDIRPKWVVYPDAGASARYGYLQPLAQNILVCSKVRDQSTGQILSHEIVDCPAERISKSDRFLIIDDICDGGATFVSVAKALRAVEPDIQVDLFVTHGIFSKGREALLSNGINNIYTTTSLLKNQEGFKV